MKKVCMVMLMVLGACSVLAFEMPTDDQIPPFDYTVFDRPLNGGDYRRKSGPVYQLIWGRNVTPTGVAQFASQVGANLIIILSGTTTSGGVRLGHGSLPTLTEDEIRRELQDSRTRLEAQLGRKVDLFCYPNGSTDERVHRIAQSIYRAAVTTEEGMVTAAADPLAIPRIPATSHLPLLAWRMHRPWA